MQIVKFLLIFMLLFPFRKIEEKNLIFYEASLVYYNQQFYLHFKKINRFFKYFIVEVNEKTSMSLKDIVSIERIDLPFLELDKTNHVKISYQDNYSVGTCFFNVNISSNNDITSSGYFSFNDFIDDYMNIIESCEELFLSISPIIYEYKENLNYIDLKKLGGITFNKKYNICKKISLQIFNEGMFIDLDYLNYYEFRLNLVSYHNNNYFSLRDYSEDQIYLPKESKEKVLSARVVFEGLYQSDIDVFFDRYIDIDYFIFNEEGRYTLVIEDE